ncbi:YopX family protein [Maribellus mangrovi]|uniref:YopX family protein n=1 Tax=Maribellus mangrovi TaxID=3133146 RepID=UPI0030ED02A5
MALRKFRFRAWDSLRNAMDYDFTTTETNGDKYFVDIQNGELTVGDIDEHNDYYELVLMQFTGLPDKKGVEIWESDIVKIPEHYDGDMLIPEVFCEVMFEDGMFCAKGNGQYDWYSIDEVQIDNYEIEVVGNIYETPNILS